MHRPQFSAIFSALIWFFFSFFKILRILGNSKPNTNIKTNNHTLTVSTYLTSCWPQKKLHILIHNAITNEQAGSGNSIRFWMKLSWLDQLSKLSLFFFFLQFRSAKFLVCKTDWHNSESYNFFLPLRRHVSCQ